MVMIQKDAAEVSPITKEMMNQALDESHNSCENGCIHMEAANACQDKEAAYVMEQVNEYLKNGANPLFGAYFFGLHVGYRLGQLASEPVSQSKAN